MSEFRAGNSPGFRNQCLIPDFAYLRVWGSKAPTMADERQWANHMGHAADVAFRLIFMQKIAHDLKTFFATEPQLPPRLQTLLRKLDEQ